jgi:ubiquinol-cytochrome c reductase cytochrome b subunit
LRNDAKTQGPRLFAKYCASCHDYADPKEQDPIRIVQKRLQTPAVEENEDPNAKPALARDENGRVVFKPSGAPNLYNIASREWIAGVLDPKQISRIESDDLMLPADAKETDPTKFLREVTAAPYFGNSAHAAGEMTDYVSGDEEFVKLRESGKVPSIVAAVSAQAALPYQKDADVKAKQDGSIAAGEVLVKANCTMCHNFGQKVEPDGTGYPDLQGYGSREWLIAFIGNPAHTRFYGDGNDRMPAFAKDRQNAANNILTQKQIEMLVDWLRRDYFEPIEQP